MGIIQEFCDAVYEELKIYKTRKTAVGKKLNPIREQDITNLIQLLETIKRENLGVQILRKKVIDFLSEMKTAEFIGCIPFPSDLRNQLKKVLERPQFSFVHMTMMELQEQQGHQNKINHELNTRLTQQEQEISLLKSNLAQRSILCDTLKTRCNTLEIENTLLKASLQACKRNEIVEQFNKLHTKAAEQGATIIQLVAELEKIKKENQKLQEENNDLKNVADKPVETPCYDSPLKNKLPQQKSEKAKIDESLSTTKNSMELNY